MAAPSWQDYYDTAKAELVLRRPDLAANQGSIADMFLAGAAAMADRLTGYFADRFRATYLDGARGDDLTTLADDHWGIVRTAAVKATGSVTLARAVANGIAGGVASGAVIATVKDTLGRDVQVETLATLSWGVSETGAKTVNVRALIAGADGNVAAGTLTRVVTAQWDSLTVTNASGLAGGAPEESDEELRERVRSFPKTIRRGTLAALQYGALQVAGVKVATAVEETDGEGNLTGIVTVYVTDASGGFSGSMVDDVATELNNWRAAGSLVNVVGGTLDTVDVGVTLGVRAGTDVTALTANIQAAVTGRLAKLKIGERLYTSMVKQVVLNVDPLNIVEAVVTLNSADVLFLDPTDAGHIIRAGTVTVG